MIELCCLCLVTVCVVFESVKEIVFSFFVCVDVLVGVCVGLRLCCCSCRCLCSSFRLGCCVTD